MLSLILLTLVGAGKVQGSTLSSDACLAGEACQSDMDEVVMFQTQSGMIKSHYKSLELGGSKAAFNATAAESEEWGKLWEKINAWLGKPDTVHVTAPQPLSEAEVDNLVRKIPCPFIAAVVKARKILPAPDRTWTAFQGKRFFADMVHPLVSGMKQVLANVFRDYLIHTFFSTAAAMGFDEEATSSLNEYTTNTLHQIHTGIRLPALAGKPDAWTGPCDSNAAEAWKRDPNCGKPGPQPHVFDMLVKSLGEERAQDDYKWQEGEIEKLCDEGRKVFYDSENEGSLAPCFQTGHAHRPTDMLLPDGSRSGRTKEDSREACQSRCRKQAGCSHFSYWSDGGCHLQDEHATLTSDWGSTVTGPPQCEAYNSGGMPDGCSKLYGIAFKMFGVITTKEWKTFLMDATFPAGWTAWKDFEPL